MRGRSVHVRTSMRLACRLAFLASVCCSISRATEFVLPEKPDAAETAASVELARVWAKACAEPQTPHVRFYIGDTIFGHSEAPLPAGIDEDGFRILSRNDGSVIIRGATPRATRFGVSWFCEHELGVRWFVPGEMGEVVPRVIWTPINMDRVVQPAFLSRSLIGMGEDGDIWATRNGLFERWPHDHALRKVIPSDRFYQHPDWFPLLEGHRYKPSSPDDFDWQPNLANPAVAGEASRYAQRYFEENPNAEAVSLSINDSIRFDQSAETLAARGPLRWFRNRPDYSDVVFLFENRVAEAVASSFPRKHISAYAYYWCEDAPRFRVHPNVIPWLTADRTQWYDAAFGGEDRALIRRWCDSGASIVGCYEYLYGSPYLVPRVTSHLTADSLKYEYACGVRAFTAEANPHWAFDGPKLWLLAQLLWDPGLSPEALLGEFYSKFFGKAAAPMRAFYAECEWAWLHQHGSASWIKYYQDEDQCLLFPPAVRAQLRRELEKARALDEDDPIAERRVAWVASAFSASDAFCKFNESREVLSNAASASSALTSEGASNLAALRNRYLLLRQGFLDALSGAVSIGAMRATNPSVYLFNDPGSRADLLLASRSRRSAQPQRTASEKWVPAPIQDPDWNLLKVSGHATDTDFIWNQGPWLGRGEPCIGRSIRVERVAGQPNRLVLEHCSSEHLWQWVALRDAAEIRVTSEFRGVVSPGNQEYIMISWLDSNGGYVGNAFMDRVPHGVWAQERQLAIDVAVPSGAKYLGVALYSFSQSSPDRASFTPPRVMFRRK